MLLVLLAAVAAADFIQPLPSYSISGRDGSVFGMTYDPLLAQPVAAIIPLQFLKVDVFLRSSP